MTFWIRFGMSTRGAAHSPSPPEGSVNENGASSPCMLSPTILFDSWCIFSSHARNTFDAFSHLKLHQSIGYYVCVTVNDFSKPSKQSYLIPWNGKSYFYGQCLCWSNLYFIRDVCLLQLRLPFFITKRQYFTLQQSRWLSTTDNPSNILQL